MLGLLNPDIDENLNRCGIRSRLQMDRLDALQLTCTLCQLHNGVSFGDNEMQLNSELSLDMVISKLNGLSYSNGVSLVIFDECCVMFLNEYMFNEDPMGTAQYCRIEKH